MSNKDEAWDTLVRETRANPAFDRGQIAYALKAIREAARLESVADDDLPGLISERAQAYRDTFPNCALTPTALAKHWCRVDQPRVSETTARINRLRLLA